MFKKLLILFSLLVILILPLFKTPYVLAANCGGNGQACCENSKCDSGFVCAALKNSQYDTGYKCMSEKDYNVLLGTYKDGIKLSIPGVNYSQLLNATGQNQTTTIGSLISKIIPYLFTIAGIILLLFLILSGFQFIFAAGDPKKIESAKAHITSALIGFVIVFISYWLVQVLARIFNIPSIISIFG